MLRKTSGKSRRAVIQDALCHWLDSQAQAALVREYQAGYRRKPEGRREIRPPESVREKGSRSRRVVKASVYTFTAVFEPAVEGGYTVTVPMLPGVITEGDSLVQARTRVREAIAGYLKVLGRHRQPVPVERKKPRRPIAERVAISV